jgi:pyruvate dehydrogenase E2 component (dihydrolipoamide acetyltransferase)
LKDYQELIESKEEIKISKTIENKIEIEEIKIEKNNGERIFISPLAKNLAEEKGVKIEKVIGTGPNNRIIKEDILDYLKKPVEEVKVVSTIKKQEKIVSQIPENSQFYQDIPNSQIRQITADRLLESKQTIPHYYLTIECEIDSLMKLRNKLNEYGEKRGFKLSVNDFVIKAAAKALKKVPEVNSSWQNTFIRQYN